MDELALATNTDAVDFRRKYLSHKGDLAVVNAVAEKAGWKPHVGARKQQRGDVFVGQGFAYSVRGQTRVALIAEGRSQSQHGQGVGAQVLGGA